MRKRFADDRPNQAGRFVAVVEMHVPQSGQGVNCMLGPGVKSNLINRLIRQQSQQWPENFSRFAGISFN